MSFLDNPLLVSIVMLVVSVLVGMMSYKLGELAADAANKRDQRKREREQVWKNWVNDDR